MYIAIVYAGRVIDVREVPDGTPLPPWEVQIPAMIPVGTGWSYVDGLFRPPG